MNFQFRKLGQEDIALLQYVGRVTYEPYYPHVWKTGGLDWYMEKCFGEKTLLAELSDSNIEYLLFTDQDGQNVGFMKLVLKKTVPGGVSANALYLEKIYLMPAFFRQGVGQKLIEFAVEKARQLRREAIWLEVMKTGPVQAYERAGFQNIGPARFEHDLLREEERDGWVMFRRI